MINMKKIITSFVAALFAVPSFAQLHSGGFSLDETSVYYGVRLGLNVSSFSGDHVSSKLDSKAGLTFGGVLGLSLSDVITPLFLESGLYYTQLGAKENKDEVNLNYLEMPLLIKAGFEVSNDFAILPFIGPTFGLGIAGKTKGYDDNNNFYSHSSFGKGKCLRPDVGIKIGSGIEWNVLYLELGYRFGVANVYDSDEFSLHNNAFFANIGVNF